MKLKEKTLRTIAKYIPRRIRYLILLDSWAKYNPTKEVPACSMDEITKYFKD